MDYLHDKPHIGLFNDSFPPVLDGVTLTVWNYAEWLYSHELNPCVVTPDSPERMAAPYPVLRYFSLPIASRQPYRYGYPRLDLRIHRELRRRPFSIIHSHSPFSAGRLALYASRKQGVPLIGTFHSKYRTDLEHSLGRYPGFVNLIMKRIMHFFESCTEVWIPQRQVEDTIREYGFRGAVQVVPNGDDMTSVDASKLPEYKRQKREQLGIPPGSVALLFVGQHILEKGIGVIADALVLLHRRGVPFVMHFIGTGYALEELRERVRREGLEKVVAVHGMVTDRSQLADYYAASDLFLFPSYYDNAPLVVREAAGMGTPAILPRGSTAAEVITDGITGFLCERSGSDYAAMVERLACTPGQMLATGLRARQAITRTWESVMQEVAGRYEALSNGILLH